MFHRCIEAFDAPVSDQQYKLLVSNVGGFEAGLTIIAGRTFRFPSLFSILFARDGDFGGMALWLDPTSLDLVGVIHEFRHFRKILRLF